MAATDALDALRTRAADLVAERQSLERASLSRAEAEARIGAFVAMQAAQVRINGADFARERGAPSEIVARVGSGDSAVGSTGPGANVAPVLCWLEPERVTARLVADLDGVDFGPDSDARRERLEEIDIELFGVELDEERELVRLLADGVTVVRRRGLANPIVLALRTDVRRPPRVVNAPPELGGKPAPRAKRTASTARGA